MDTEKVCQHCGKPLGAKDVHGLCPECFMKVGLGSEAGSVTAKLKTFVPPQPEALAPHFPQLEILQLLGKGGMGAVYKARQKALNRLVALKVLPSDAAHDPAFTERFTREAQALAQLNHSNIVTVHEFGQAGGFYFFIMEFVDGANLRQLLRTHRLSPREAMAIVPQICDALQYAHDQGIVHRDIKPENVLVDKQGKVKIADFGLAKLLGRDPAGERLTRSAEVMGTPQYMAPEQLERPLEVDHRADIYSLGVVFYEMLTGELPLGRFPAPSRKVEVDVRLDEIVLRALEKEPQLRYQQASVLKTDVETVSGSVSSAAPGNIPRNGQPARRPGPPSAPEGFALSRLAVLGVALAPLYVLAPVLVRVLAGPGSLNPSTNALSVGSGLAAMFGTTILGWVAVAQIRHSAGRLYGIGLALFDGLLFPLLVLDCFIIKVCGKELGEVGQSWVLEHGLHESVWYKLALLGHQLLLFGIAAFVDIWIVRRVWAAVQGRPQPAGGRISKLIAASAVLIILATAPLLILSLLSLRKSPPTFAPEREVTLQDCDIEPDGLDFETGRVLVAPRAAADQLLQGDGSWVKQNGVDLLVDTTGKGLGLITTRFNKLKLVKLVNDDWQTLSPRKLREALANGVSGLAEEQMKGVGMVYMVPTNTPLPLTLAFETGTGGRGIVQLTRFGEGPQPPLTLRYKLLREDGVGIRH